MTLTKIEISSKNDNKLKVTTPLNEEVLIVFYIYAKPIDEIEPEPKYSNKSY